MELLLRKYAEWKGRRKAAQVIIFDGAAEMEKTRSFGQGLVLGILVATLAYVLVAPSAVEPALLDEMTRRETLIHEANQRAEEAMLLTNLCLTTAQGMERTLGRYQRLLQPQEQGR